MIQVSVCESKQHTTQHDQRRMDIVATPGARAVGARRGVPLFCDVTICSTHTQRGEARPGADNTDGATILRAVGAKRRRYNDVHQGSQASLWVIEVTIIYIASRQPVLFVLENVDGMLGPAHREFLVHYLYTDM